MEDASKYDDLPAFGVQIRFAVRTISKLYRQWRARKDSPADRVRR